MTLESDFKAIMIADGTLMALLTGGVFTQNDLGRENAGDQTGARDTAGFIKPLAIIRPRAPIPDSQVNDQEQVVMSATQVIEIWLYEDTNFSNIDAAALRLLKILYGRHMTNTFPVEWMGTPIRDRAPQNDPLAGNSMIRQDWLVPMMI